MIIPIMIVIGTALLGAQADALEIELGSGLPAELRFHVVADDGAVGFEITAAVVVVVIVSAAGAVIDGGLRERAERPGASGIDAASTCQTNQEIRVDPLLDPVA